MHITGFCVFQGQDREKQATESVGVDVVQVVWDVDVRWKCMSSSLLSSSVPCPLPISLFVINTIYYIFYSY